VSPLFRESRGIPRVEGRMDGQRFDNLARLFSAPLNRKGFLAVLAGIAAPAALGDDGAAKKRKRQKRSSGGGDVEPQGIVGDVCSGFCTKDADCLESPDCICDLDTNRCQTVLCGGSCVKDADCGDLPGCACIVLDIPTDLRACGTPTCDGFCNKGLCRSGQPEGDSCVCDFATNTCATIACPGFCNDNADCTEQGEANCVCFPLDSAGARAGVGMEGEPPAGACGACLGEGAACNASTECCSPLACDESSGECVTVACPGRCNDNDDCLAQGQDQCACILSITRLAADALDVGAEGEAGACGECRGVGASCTVTSECCGQLVCDGGADFGASGAVGDGACRPKPKPKPKDRCHKHGQSCRRDNDCCAQASCYKGKCGEKDTHCHNDSECAQGYRCQGGPLSPGHRRCRKNGRRNRNRRNKNGSKR
jgi:hypothetical protein